MKRITNLMLIVSLIFLGIVYFRYSHLKQENQVFKSSKSTEIQIIGNNIVDLGKISNKAPAQVIFLLKNSGPNPLIIQSVYTDCHCTSSEWNKEPIAPNDTLKISLEYDAKKIGFFSKKAIVRGNFVSGSQLLIIRGTVL